MVRVVMIDDNDLVRNTLRKTSDRYRDIEVVGEADCEEAGLKSSPERSPRDADAVPKRQDPPGRRGCTAEA
jgi:DNA-binding NarL/FixJ family response regulator